MIELDYLGLNQQDTTNLQVLQKASRRGYKWESLSSTINVNTAWAILFEDYKILRDNIYEINASITFRNGQATSSSCQWIILSLDKNGVALTENVSGIYNVIAGGEYVIISLNWIGKLLKSDVISLKARAALSTIVQAESSSDKRSQWSIKEYSLDSMEDL